MTKKLVFKILVVHGDRQNSYEIVSHDENDYNQLQLYIENQGMEYLLDNDLQGMCLSSVLCGNIVILDTTSYHPDTFQKEGQSILVMIPEKLTEFHLQTMEDVMTLFEGVNVCRIWYDIVKKNGEIRCQSLKGNADIIKEYLNHYQNGKSR